jgi:DNA-binding NtrC family response regulator
VRLADSADEVLKCALRHEPLDLVILDPDLPGAEDTSLLRHLFDRIPALPVIVHTIPPNTTARQLTRGSRSLSRKGATALNA